jgi:hypothetical protein
LLRQEEAAVMTDTGHGALDIGNDQHVSQGCPVSAGSLGGALGQILLSGHS